MNVSCITAWKISPYLWELWGWILSTILGHLMWVIWFSCIGFLSFVKFLAEHVTGLFRIFILVTPCWMEASWLPTVLNMLEDIPHHCPIIKCFCGAGVQESPIITFNPLAVKRCVFCPDKGSLPKSLRQLEGRLEKLWQKLPLVLKIGQLVYLRECTKQCHFFGSAWPTHLLALPPVDCGQCCVDQSLVV